MQCGRTVGKLWQRERPLAYDSPTNNKYNWFRRDTTSNTAMARTKQTARKVSGKSTTTKPSAEKEELLKLKRAERAEAKRVKHLKAEEDKNTVCGITISSESRCVPTWILRTYSHTHRSGKRHSAKGVQGCAWSWSPRRPRRGATRCQCSV
ncbi:hypothetical protein EI94DRAFT_1203018 [Lactarius quietus]|nr:hypothetical protein EI94DRAFT_1203018 [Lactarius quietus]